MRFSEDHPSPARSRRGRPMLWEDRRAELLRRVSELYEKHRSLRIVSRELHISKSSVAALLKSGEKVSDNS